MKFMVVIDTNVLVSALLSKHDDAATVQILNLVFDGTIIPVYNAEILDEYCNVLHRKKFKFTEENIKHFTQQLKELGFDYFTKDNLPILATKKNNEGQIQMCFDAYKASNHWKIYFD